jgi:hypothetical protein
MSSKKPTGSYYGIQSNYLHLIKRLLYNNVSNSPCLVETLVLTSVNYFSKGSAMRQSAAPVRIYE